MTLEILSVRADTLTRDDTGAVVVRATAELDAETLVSAVAQRDAVVIDLADVRACDDRLLNAFRIADAEAKKSQATLEFRRVLPPVRHALEHAHLDWRIQLVGEHGA